MVSCCRPAVARLSSPVPVRSPSPLAPATVHRSVAAAALLLLAAAPLGAQRPTTRLAWLAGCWQLRAGPRLTEEQWLAPRGGTMLGVSRTTRGDTLREYEFLRIREAGDTLVYVASPSGQATTEFRASAVTDGLVTFENPAHDFPQRIVYRRVGADSVIARIEGTMRGQARGVDFPFARVRCDA